MPDTHLSMEDIATRFEKEAQCIDEQVGGRIISRQAGREARAILDSDFARALADQYLKLPSFTEEGRARVTAVVFARAWRRATPAGTARSRTSTSTCPTSWTS